jgi:NAD(P)-dependent dehydrogenase (short-subunit alcohol dehydrogenase family)
MVATEIYCRKLDFENLQGERSYNFFKADQQSKLCSVLFAFELGRRLDGTKVTSNVVSPGPSKIGFGANMTGPAHTFTRIMKANRASVRIPHPHTTKPARSSGPAGRHRYDTDADRRRHQALSQLLPRCPRRDSPTRAFAAMLRFHNGWLVINSGGGPTPDKPEVTMTRPRTPPESRRS